MCNKKNVTLQNAVFGIGQKHTPGTGVIFVAVLKCDYKIYL